MKDTQYFPGPPKSWNGGIMSGGGAPTEGRGAPWPPAHHQLARSGPQVLSFLGSAPAAHLNPWPPSGPKPPLTSSGMDLSSRPPAGIDLSRARSPLPNGALNGSSAPPLTTASSAVPKESVSVIAPNPLRPLPPMSDDNSMAVDEDDDDDEDDDCMVIDDPLQPPTAHAPPTSVVPASGPSSPHMHQPLSFSATTTVSSAPHHPSPPPSQALTTVASSVTPTPSFSSSDEPSVPVSPAPVTVTTTSHQTDPVPAPISLPLNHRLISSSQAVDHVESLLENMFQQEEPPIPHPVIVPNCLRPPLLTEDKVVAMLEESGTPEKAVPVTSGVPATSISTTAAKNTPPSSTPSSTSATSIVTASPSSTSTSASLFSSSTSSPSTVNAAVSVPSVTGPSVPPVPSINSVTSKTSVASQLASNSSPNTFPAQILEGKPSQQNQNAPLTHGSGEAASNTFLQVESELARMFAGIVEPAEEQPTAAATVQTSVMTTTMNQETVTPGTAIVARVPARRRVRKPRERRGRPPQRSSGLPRERRVAAPPPHKDGSSDGSVAGMRVRGPFLRISGDRLCPTSVVLVNAARDDEERDRPVDPTKRRPPRIVEGRVKGPGLYSSTLSAKYNSNSIDISWMCSFCHKRSHCSGGLGGEPAGDLFGPYTVTLRPMERGDGPSDAVVAGAQRLHGSRGRGQSLRIVNAIHSVNHRSSHHKSCATDEKAEEGREVWAHEQCLVWAPGVMMVGPHLVGLDDALTSSLRSKCTECGEVGAGIGCLEHNCHAVVHYGCATSRQWHLDEENFHAHCPLHRKVKVLSLEMLKTGT